MFVRILTASAAAIIATMTTAGEPLQTASDSGIYTVQIAPHKPGVTIGELHTWNLRLADSDGELIGGASVRVDGGMPAHGHGLPTAPKVTDAGEAGHYRIEGLRFNMPGDWELRLTIEGAAGDDTATFRFQL